MTEYRDETPKSIPEKIDHGVSFNQLYSKDSIRIFQKLGHQFRVNVVILKKEGEKYTHNSIDPKTGKQTSVGSLVPEGKSYIHISSERNDLGDFWEAVRAERASQKNPSNPPKI